MRLGTLIAALLAALLFIVPATAQQNPLTGKATTESGAAKNPFTGKPTGAPPARGNAKAEAGASSGWFSGAVRWLFDQQRKANRAIATHMREIRDGRTLGPLLFGILLALVYGAVHALGPGHGKFVVVTYFLAREAKIARGFLMGLQIAVFHVIAAIVAVYVARAAMRQIFGGEPAEIQAVRIISYGLIAIIGLFMLAQALRRVFGRKAGHGHDHDHGAGCASCAHAHGGQMTLLSLTVGLVPCTGALLIMLYALANDILLAGTILVAAISIGMAGTLAVLGVASILFRRAVERGLARQSNSRAGFTHGFEIVGGVLITAVGSLLLAGVLWGPSA